MNADESSAGLGTYGATPSTPPATGSASVESDEYAQAVSAYIKEVVASAVKAERERVVDLIAKEHRMLASQLEDKFVDLVRNGD